MVKILISTYLIFRQGSFVGQYAKQWDSPRGSVSHPAGPRSRSPGSGQVTPRGSVSRVGHVPKLSTTSPLARDNSETNMGAHANKIRAQKVGLQLRFERHPSVHKSKYVG